MKSLIEMIGRRNGISDIDIYNQIGLIDNNIEKLVKAELNVTTDEIILCAIEYSLSLKLQMEYKTILNYFENERI